MRKIILAILGVLVVASAVFFGNQLVEKNRKPKPKFKKQIKHSIVASFETTQEPQSVSNQKTTQQFSKQSIPNLQLEFNSSSN